MVLATGNLGRRLTSNDSPKNLYISRDGGLTWKSTKPGSYIYEIGDHGALIVIAKKNQPTTDIEFSWDEGLTWETLKISDKSMYIENIIIEPNSVSQQFIVYGVQSANGLSTNEQELVANETKAFLTYVDFSSLHVAQCKGAESAGSPTSDFELWTPNDGRHGVENKCFLG